MKQGPFLLGLCHKGAFTDFLRFFSFCCFFEPVAESCMWPPAHKWDKPSPTAGKPGRMVYLPDQTGLARRINHILPCIWFARFHASGSISFLFVFSSFCGFFPEVFSRICLYFRLPPFLRLSVAASVSHFRSGRKGNSGIWRKCKVEPPVFWKNLQSCG